MAWLQNLAGRAEDLLNKIDKNAATVLNESTNKSPENNESNRTGIIPEVPKVISDFKNKSIITKIEGNQENGNNLEKMFVENIDNDNIFERTYKQDSTSSKSSSMHNSFVLSEDSQNFSEKIVKLEFDNNELHKQLLNLQHLYSEIRNENCNLKTQIDNANQLALSAQTEMEQYKARAQRILQEKEQLLGLKQENNSDDADNILYKYNDELKKELEFQQNKNKELIDKINKSNNEILSLHQQIMILQSSLQKTNKSLQQNISDEKHIRQVSEEELKLKTQELNLKIQELNQQYNIIKIKNEEIEHLKDVIKQRTNINCNNEYEIRIKSLTDTLMLKQNSLETVTTERNALRLQLEKLESEYHNSLAQLQRSQVRIINVNDTDDVKSQVPQFMRVSPLDAGVTRRVKHAYSTVDAISIKTAVFLRRYPVARVFMFCYIIILQLWAIFVLFWYAPNGR